jgi:hypothetical protein
MSHNGQNLEDISPKFKELIEYQAKINKTFPHGKLNEQDEGALSFGVSSIGDKVIIAFGEPTSWLGLTGDQAAELGVLLISRAKEAGIKNPITIEL